MDGGMICPSVPAAAIEPQAREVSYLRRSMVGRDSRPMVTTVAPTMPVEAASSAPTTDTEMPRPPRRLPNSRPMVSSNSSATLERSSITPMKTNSGTAISNSLVIAPPKILDGSAPKREKSNTPKIHPIPAKISAVPASVNATGNPAIRNRHTTTNMMMVRISENGTPADLRRWAGLRLRNPVFRPRQA